MVGLAGLTSRPLTKAELAVKLAHRLARSLSKAKYRSQFAHRSGKFLDLVVLAIL